MSEINLMDGWKIRIPNIILSFSVGLSEHKVYGERLMFRCLC